MARSVAAFAASVVAGMQAVVVAAAVVADAHLPSESKRRALRPAGGKGTAVGRTKVQRE